MTGVIRNSLREGMQDFTENLCKFVMDGVIDPKEALRFAPNAEELKMALKGIKTTTEGLMM